MSALPRTGGPIGGSRVDFATWTGRNSAPRRHTPETIVPKTLRERYVLGKVRPGSNLSRRKALMAPWGIEADAKAT